MRANIVAKIAPSFVPCFRQELVKRLRAEMPSDEQIEDARSLLAAVADKNRLKVLHALRLGGKLCVCDVAHVLGMSISTASHHLRKLRDLGILAHRNEGKMTHCFIKDRFASDLAKRVLQKAVA